MSNAHQDVWPVGFETATVIGPCSVTYRIDLQIGRTRVLAAPQTFNGFHGKKKIVEVEYRDK